MKKTHIKLISAAIAALMFVGCKPTENNYKAAYDAAKAKREAAAAEQMRPATGLLSDDGPQLRVVDGDTLYVVSERLRMLDGATVTPRWIVAVGLFKMDTNAKATVEDLRSEGFADAFVAKAKGGKYYAVSSTAASLDSARIEQKNFRLAHPHYPYVGLPGAPVLISN